MTRQYTKQRVLMTKKLLYELLINDKIQSLQNDINWYELLTLSITEKVEGYLYKYLLDNVFLENIPKQVRKILYISYKYNQEKNKLYLKEFQNLQELLSKNKILIFPYKGIFLITEVYKDYGIRYMEDIDILTFETDYRVLKALLETYHYKLTLINDKDLAYYNVGETINSCLFLKKNSEMDLVPFIKLDISSIFASFNTYESTTYFNGDNLLPEYVFVLICKSFFDDACEKSQSPGPENCTLIKLIDIISFINKYPKQVKYVLEYSDFSETKFIIFTRNCINYFCKGVLL